MWSVCHWDAENGLIEDATAHDKSLAQACRDDYVGSGLIPDDAFVIHSKILPQEIDTHD